MWIAETADPTTPVAIGVLIGHGGEGLFHCRPFPPHFVRINVEKVLIDTTLMVPVEEADQTNLSDALGTSVLWLRSLTFAQE